MRNIFRTNPGKNCGHEGLAAPVELRLLNAADRAACFLGLCQASLRPEELMRVAQRRTGLADFGTSSFEEPLEILLRDYDRAANLSLFGRATARWDVLRFLTNLLRLRERERRQPEILDEPIERPIFITGMPRSGSSFLQNVIGHDPYILMPRAWQTIYPCPRASDAKDPPRRRIKAVDRQLAGYRRLVPEIAALHPLGANLGQECNEILAHVFRSHRFDSTHQLADYPGWLERAGDLPAFRFHKRFLQHLQHRVGPRRWILKCPEHIFSIESIRAVYPDASFVFMHRDPISVLFSVAKLTEVLRRPFSRHVDRLAIGRQVKESWIHGASLMIEKEKAAAASGRPVLNIHYRNLIGDPIATIKNLYKAFDVPLSEESERRMRESVGTQRNGGSRKAIYRGEDFGLDAHELAAQFRDYISHFAIERESREAGSDVQVEPSKVGRAARVAVAE